MYVVVALNEDGEASHVYGQWVDEQLAQSWASTHLGTHQIRYDVFPLLSPGA